jgi:hypothetical protein
MIDLQHAVAKRIESFARRIGLWLALPRVSLIRFCAPRSSGATHASVSAIFNRLRVSDLNAHFGESSHDFEYSMDEHMSVGSFVSILKNKVRTIE